MTRSTDWKGGALVQERALGRVQGALPGPTLICVAGLHGNELAGVHGVRRVIPRLAARAPEMRGAFVALAGNLAALSEGRRFVDRDLNRAWTDERILQLREAGSVGELAEDLEQLALLRAIEEVVRARSGTVYVLDLHTTSGPGGIFSAFTDSLPQRAFAAHFPVPMIFGLEEQVDGTLLNLLSEQGFVSITVETGQHDEPAAVDRAEAAVWIAVEASGLLPGRLVPEATDARKRLRRDAGHLPRALEMRYRHPLEDGDGFAMDPGYSNFQPVGRGQVIARDARGEIRVEEGALLLMPLYQEQGEDGFFLVREFLPFWMHVSYVLRRLGAARVAHLLPGVQRVPGTDDEVVVDKRIARFYAKQLFHLLGFRQMEDAGSRLVMRRRRFDEGRYLEAMPAPDSLDPGMVNGRPDAEA